VAKVVALMARPATGTIIERRNAAGRIDRTLRFPVNGHKRRIPLGQVTREVAEDRLAVELAKVRDGEWAPPAPPEPVRDSTAPMFHAYAEQWWSLTEGQLSANTQADYRWRLEKHLLGYFGPMPLDTIKAASVEAYIAGKLAGVIYKDGREVRRESPLSARSINMTLILLGAILERAVKHELIDRNAARGCRAKERAPARSYLETAAQIRALLDAAGELDRTAAKDRRHVERRAMIATLTLAGLRIGELLALRWRDVDLAAGWLTVGEAKTDAGRRRVKIRGALRDELVALRGRRQDAPQAAYVFPTRTGARMGAENFRNRVLGCPAVMVDGEKKAGTGTGAVGCANANLEGEGLPPLPVKLTPHSLRRTFCSLLYALGETPPVVMQEMGHTDPALALKVYAQAMRRGENEQQQLGGLVEGFRPPMDRSGDPSDAEQVARQAT
jgi:integrase